jgi:hypothetical protein
LLESFYPTSCMMPHTGSLGLPVSHRQGVSQELSGEHRSMLKEYLYGRR